MSDPTPTTTPISEAALSEWREKIQNARQQLRQQIGRIVVGQDQVVDEVLLVLFCQGHALLVGVPGLAKTLLVSTIARALSLDFSRIQFTPDLMPSDITGTEMIEEDKTTGRRSQRFMKGPIFTQMLLADEINRTPPKTQSALLEAMQEKQVTVAGVKYPLAAPFFVLATQNPIEQEGTYPLPEAQLDRFMFQIHVGYPSEAEELEIVRRTTINQHVDVEPVLTAEEVLAIQQAVRDVPVADHVIRYALRLVRATRVASTNKRSEHETYDFIDRYLAWGAGPRASQYLILAGKSRAILAGRSHVDIEDIQAVVQPVLRHRLLLNFNAEADGMTVDRLIDQLVEAVSIESLDATTNEELNRVMN